jgi:hypothetical protein
LLERSRASMKRCKTMSRHTHDRHWRELGMWLAEMKTWARSGGCGNSESGVSSVKTPKFSGPMSLTVFHHQFEAVVRHNWPP